LDELSLDLLGDDDHVGDFEDQGLHADDDMYFLRLEVVVL
jgi:hypothetical protein